MMATGWNSINSTVLDRAGFALPIVPIQPASWVYINYLDPKVLEFTTCRFWSKFFMLQMRTMKPRNRKTHAQGHTTRRREDQARYQASQWGFFKMKIGLGICLCLGRQEASALDSSRRRLVLPSRSEGPRQGSRRRKMQTGGGQKERGEAQFCFSDS